MPASPVNAPYTFHRGGVPVTNLPKRSWEYYQATGNHNLRELGVSGITRTGSLTGVEVQGACKNVKPTSVQKFADHFLDVVRPGRPLHPIRALFHPAAAGSHAQPHAGGASQSNQPQSGEPSQPHDGTGGAAPQNNPPQPGSE